MFPLLIVSSNNEELERFLSDYKTTHHIDNYYIYTITPLKSEITIDQMRLVKKELLTQSAQPKLFIIYSFDTASTEAQNALLKTLEEKNSVAHFLCIVETLGRVLPTIQSRSQVIQLTKDTVVVSPEIESLLAATISSSDYHFFSKLDDIKTDRAEVVKLLGEAIIFFRKRLLIDEHKAALVMKKILETKGLLNNNNLSPQLALDNILIFVKKVYNMKHEA